MTREPTEAEHEMVAELLSTIVLKIQPFIEGDFLDSFSVKFTVGVREFELSLKKISDPYLPTKCQSKEDGICNLKIGSCQQCL